MPAPPRHRPRVTPDRMVFAVDAMGGDHAPDAIIDGVGAALATHGDIAVTLWGDSPALKARAEALGLTSPHLSIAHAPDIVASDALPSRAVRTGRQSSMRLALNAVAEGKADCAISAGNTGALMAMALLALRPLPMVYRPAITTVLPNREGAGVILDLGANAEGPPESLVQFAVMGALYSQAVLGVDTPRIGLLNMGSEEVKGQDRIKAAHLLLNHAAADGVLPGRYVGFVEGNQINDGGADVFVTDGFTGNVALKTLEGTVQHYNHLLRQLFTSNLRAKLAYLLLKPSLKALKQKVDVRNYNGAMLIGVNGVVIKSHGSADAYSFSNAVRIARSLVERDILARIDAGLSTLQSAASQRLDGGEARTGDT